MMFYTISANKFHSPTTQIQQHESEINKNPSLTTTYLTAISLLFSSIIVLHVVVNRFYVTTLHDYSLFPAKMMICVWAVEFISIFRWFIAGVNENKLSNLEYNVLRGIRKLFLLSARIQMQSPQCFSPCPPIE